MSTWVCASCDNRYDTEQGDIANAIAPGTSMEALPQDWVCPACGAAKINYAQIAGSSRDGSGWSTSNS